MKYILIIISILFSINLAFADQVPSKSTITLLQNEVLVKVHGVVCSFCAYGTSKKLSKLDYVDHSKLNKGVLVDIDNQKIKIAIKPEEKPNLNEITTAIKDGGYEPIAIYSNLDGKGTVENIIGGEK